MAFYAIEPNGNTHRLGSNEAIITLQKLHRANGVNGWAYGQADSKEQLENLKKRNRPAAERAAETLRIENTLLESENEALKAKLAELQKAAQGNFKNDNEMSLREIQDYLKSNPASEEIEARKKEELEKPEPRKSVITEYDRYLKSTLVKQA